MVVAGHLTLAVIDRPHGKVRGANLLSLHPGWAVLLAAAPMPVFFAAGGYANATASLAHAARRLRVLAALGAVVVTAWSIAVAVAVLTTGHPGIVGQGARLATQPLWFLAAYAPFSAAGRRLALAAGRHPVLTIGGCLAGLALLDLARFSFDAGTDIGWVGFALAWVVPWLAGGWWRHRVEHGGLAERRTGVVIAATFIGVGIMLVQVCGYSPALIDAVPGARSNTTPPTLYTAVAGLAQFGVLLMLAGPLDRLGRRWRRAWDRAGVAAVGVYAWHLTALSLCAAAVAAGVPVPLRLTAAWWLTRPIWWGAVLAVTGGLVVATDRVRHHPSRHPADATPADTTPADTPPAGTPPTGTPSTGRSSSVRLVSGVAVLTGAAAAVGLEGPHSLPLAAAWSGLFIGAWVLLRA